MPVSVIHAEAMDTLTLGHCIILKLAYSKAWHSNAHRSDTNFSTPHHWIFNTLRSFASGYINEFKVYVVHVKCKCLHRSEISSRLLRRNWKNSWHTIELWKYGSCISPCPLNVIASAKEVHRPLIWPLSCSYMGAIFYMTYFLPN